MKSLGILILLFCLVVADPCVASKKKKSKSKPKEKINPIVELMKKRPDQTSWYDRYFSQADERMSRNYWANPVIADPSGMASGVLRERLHLILEETTRASDGQRALDKAKAAIINAGQVTIKPTVTQPHEIPTEWRMGYDVFTDAAKLECRRGVFSAGVYQPAFFGNAPKGQAFFDALNIRMATEFPQTSSSAYLAYRWNSYLLETGFSKRLSKTVETQVSTTQPIKDGPTTYLMKFLFNF